MKPLAGAVSIHDLVRSGRITPADGAMLLELRRQLAYARKPWWERAIRFVLRGLFT